MRLRFITACMGGALLALALGGCGQQLIPPETTSPTATPAIQSSQLQPPSTAHPSIAVTPSTPTVPGFTPEAPTPQSVSEQAPTLTPVSSIRAPVVTPTYSRRTPFVPLDQPAFLTATESDHLPDEDLVLGLEWMGEARAYPIRMLTYHHIVNDNVAGRALLVTY